MAESETIIHKAPENQEKIRLDLYISKMGLGLSRSQAQKLIENSCVLINGNSVKPHYLIKAKDEIQVLFPKKETTKVIPENIPLEIYFEDEYLLVVNKPAGMVVHPAPGNYSGTLVNALLYHCGDLSSMGGRQRPGIVHRLDKDTSGLLMVAKTNEVHRQLAKQLERRTLNRKYLTVVWGKIERKEGTIEVPIGRYAFDRKKMAVTPFASREAITNFHLQEEFDVATLLELKLLTGRTHQIRVHLAHYGHPVVGDPTYGGRKRSLIFEFPKNLHTRAAQLMDLASRQVLHAGIVGFVHPVSGEYLEFSSPLPEDIKKVLEFLRAGAR
ncbi:MAG: RluA family pseudouridine synthase [Candidatus Edwardsbacteria bacterium]